MIAVIGGGLSGLAIAVELQRWCEQCIVFESGIIPGGVIQSETIDGYLLEYGANSLLADKDIKEYVKNLGLEGEIVYPEVVSKNRYLYRNGRYHKLPENPVSLLSSRYLTFNSKLAIIKEFFKKPALVVDETIGQFIERRFSKEITDYLLAPFISGIYAGDPYKILLSKSFPFLQKYEQEYGSVMKGVIKNKSQARRESLYFKSGMQELTDTLAKKVKNLRLETKVTNIQKTSNGFAIDTEKNGIKEVVNCEAIVLASPADATSEVISSLKPDFSAALKKLTSPPIVKVFLGYKKEDISFSLNGFGGLNPPCEKQFSMGSLWNSSIYPFTAPEGQTLITTLIGGSIQQENTLLNDDEIINKVSSDNSRYFRIKGKPSFSYVKRIPKAVPQYNKDIYEVEREAELAEAENIFSCASWLNGQSLSDIIKKAQKQAIKIVESRSGVIDYKGCC